MLGKIGQTFFNSKAQLGRQNLASNNRSEVIVQDSVDSIFAGNVINQFQSLVNTFGNNDVNKLVIVKSAYASDELKKVSSRLSEKLKGDASDAYGFYDKKEKAICIIQDNHNRKDFNYEGSLAEQGSDTLTHEFGHLIDKDFSKSDKFKKAFKKDLEKFAKNLEKHPDKKIPGTDMTFAQAKTYLKHYIEGVDFSDGIDDKDITRAGHREQWAELFSIKFDSFANKANEIHKKLFKKSYKKMCDILA